VRHQAKARRSFMLITSEVSEPRGHSPGLGDRRKSPIRLIGGGVSATGEPSFCREEPRFSARLDMDTVIRQYYKLATVTGSARTLNDRPLDLRAQTRQHLRGK
jgi:hypothetical protein